MKFAVRFVVTLAVILLAIVVVGPGLINWNRYKPQIEAHLEKVLGRDVTLGGKISASFLPEPHLEANDVTIANAQGGEAPNLLQLKSLQGKIAFVPLLSGRLVIKGLRLVEPVVDLERLPDGGFNFSFAALAPSGDRSLAMFEKSDAAAPAARGLIFDPQDISIDKIEVVKGTLTYRDRVLDARETVTAFDGVLSAVTLKGPYSGEAGFAWQGRRWGLTGDVATPGQGGVRELSFKVSEAGSLLKAALVGRVSPGTGEKSPPWRVTGALTLQAERPEGFWQGVPADPPRGFALEGALAVDPEALQLKDAALRWGDFTANGTMGVTFDSRPRYTVTATGHALDLDAIFPVAADENAPRLWPLAFIAPPQADSADPAPDPASSTSEPPAGARDFLATLEGVFDLKIASVTLRDGEITALAVQGDVNGKGIALRSASARLPGKSELSLEGWLKPGGAGMNYNGALALASEDARTLLGWLGAATQDVAPDRLKRLAYDGGVDLGPGRLDLVNFKAGLDGAQAGGTLTLTQTTRDARPKIQAKIAVSRANLAPYRSMLLGGDQRPELALLDDFVAAADGTVMLAIDELNLGSYDATGVSAELKMTGGWINTASVAADDVLGAEIALMMEETQALAGRASLSWRGEASGPDLRPLLSQWHLGYVRGEAPLGPFSISLQSALQNGDGAFAFDGTLAGAQFTVGSEVKAAQAPLLGVLGPEGRVTTTVTAESDHAGELGALLGFGAHSGGADAPSSLNVRSIMEAEKREFALSAMVGSDIARLSWQRQGKDAAAVHEIDLSAKSNDVATALAALGAAPDVVRSFTGPFSLRVAAQGPADHVALSQLAYQLADEDAKGDGTLDLSGARASARLDLETSRLEVARYLDALLGRPLREEGGWAKAPLALKGLGRFDAQVNLKSEALALAGTAFEDATLTATLDKGTLKLENVAAKWAGGALTANAALRGGDALPGFALAMKFAGVDSRDVGVALLGKAIATGRVDGAISLKGQGDSPNALAAATSGEVTLKGIGGAVDGFDLAAFEGRRTALHAGDDPGPVLGALTGGQSPINAFDLAFTIDQGVARSGAGIVDFPQGRALLTGAVDLVKRAYDLDLNLPATGLIATPHLLVSGSLDAPKVVVASEGVAEALKREAASKPVPPPKQEAPPAAAPPEAAPPEVLPPGEPDRLRGLIQSLPSKTQ